MNKSKKIAILFTIFLFITISPALYLYINHEILKNSVKVALERYYDEYCGEKVNIKEVNIQNYQGLYYQPRGKWSAETDHPEFKTVGSPEIIDTIRFEGTKCDNNPEGFVLLEKEKKFVVAKSNLKVESSYRFVDIRLIIASIFVYPALILTVFVMWLRIFVRWYRDKYHKKEG
jgi:hypothetical protein